MAAPVAPIDLKLGDVVGNFQVVKKLGEGACGQVFLVSLMKDNKAIGRAAMKVEPRMVKKEDEILRMEIRVLEKIKSRHIPTMLGSGTRPTFTFLVMTLLGRELEAIRKKLPQRRMSGPSTLRIGIQLVMALKDIHEAGFVHRDVKPCNAALGFRDNKVAYILDFGLARQILLDDPKDKKKKVLRPPRSKAMFRGTNRYVSLNIHKSKDAGRHDDLISLLYSLVECATGTLPWKAKTRKEVEKLKATTSEQELCKGCPPSFAEIMKKLKGLKYADEPAYKEYVQKMRADLPAGMKMTDSYEWTKPGGKLDEFWEDKQPAGGVVSEKEAVLIEKAEQADNATNRDVQDSEATEDKDSTNEYDPDMSKENTLDDI